MGLGFLRQWQEGQLQEPNWGPLSGHKSAQGRPFHTPASAQRQGPMSSAPDGQGFSASSSSSRLLPPAGGPCSRGGGGWRGGLRRERESQEGPHPLLSPQMAPGMSSVGTGSESWLGFEELGLICGCK